VRLGAQSKTNLFNQNKIKSRMLLINCITTRQTYAKNKMSKQLLNAHVKTALQQSKDEPRQWFYERVCRPPLCLIRNRCTPHAILQSLSLSCALTSAVDGRRKNNGLAVSLLGLSVMRVLPNGGLPGEDRPAPAPRTVARRLPLALTLALATVGEVDC
jgi:hypothetical protein